MRIGSNQAELDWTAVPQILYAVPTPDSPAASKRALDERKSRADEMDLISLGRVRQIEFSEFQFIKK